MLSKEELTAVATLVARTARSQREMERADADRKDAEARYAEASREFELRRGAFAGFGFDTSVKNLWDVVQDTIGIDAWNKAVTQNQDTKGEDGEVIESTSLMNSPPDEAPEEVPIKEIVLDRLKDAGDIGTTASAIRDYINKELKRDIHEKTVGMTLYRLSKETMSRREGRMWFYVPPSAEAQNPGSGEPGSADVFS